MRKNKFKASILFLTGLLSLSISGCNDEEQKSCINHHFEEIEDDEFIQTLGNFASPSTYYKSCPNCGVISHETFLGSKNCTYEIVSEPKVFTINDLIDSYELDGATKLAVTLIANTYINECIGPADQVTFTHYTFNYLSKGIDSSDVLLSGAITIPYLNGVPAVHFVNIDNHETRIDPLKAPSCKVDINCCGVITGGAVIECDLLGMGVSSSYPMDYHCKHLATRNTVDGIIAAFNLIEKGLNISLKNLNFYNTGYSQGGYDSLALLRYMELEATNKEKERIKITKTYSGSGAYDIKIMFEESLKTECHVAPHFVLMGIISGYEFHKDLFGEHKIEDFLTEYGQKFIEPLYNKDEAKINQLLLETDGKGNKKYQKTSDFFSFDITNPDQELLNIINAFAAEESLLDGDWLPQGDLELFYTESDEMVSKNCSLRAIEKFSGLENFSYSSVKGKDHTEAAIDYYLNVVKFFYNNAK